ncbi:hypothetical protein [Halorarius litoreus]|uniref:hypothetical protein n=1 Tax=Halorarius litoreus TaxID=2962676 RepID=UPI0020CB95B3|nr:hypothetical protein [Halorarius litoreus]
MKSIDWKTLLLAVAAVSLLAMPVAAAPVSNYVENPGFESFEDGDPADWRVLAGDPSATEDAAEGQRAVLFNLRGSETGSTIAQNVSEETEDAVVGGYEYEFEFTAKHSTGAATDSTNATTAQGVILWKNAVGEVVDRDVIDIEAGSYQAYNDTFRALVDATDAEVRFTLTRESATDRTDATLKVDDVAFGPSDQQ